ncbi:MAG: hypothetical protein C0485_12565 [Pirellula sp.]|nr:hypothetical protein [Pirellula sp.]
MDFNFSTIRGNARRMTTVATSLTVFACVFAGALIGMRLRRMLPEHHLSSERKETVKLAMGFVATMAALIIGLLVASAKDSYDTQSSGVTQLAAKAVYLDRLLANFGPDANDVRQLYRGVVERIAHQMWPEQYAGEAQLDPSAMHTEELLVAIQALAPKTDLQKTLQAQAVSTSMEIGQMRWLQYEQASTTLSKPMLGILVFWIAVLFGSFGLFAPSNGTALAALLLAALSVAGAIFLILELQSPFTGLLQIPDTPFLDAIAHLDR